ncbi:hypothetical protein EVA_15539 [gut metagenome]|uniref:S-adenosylmethionine synthetase N-terminal domain-containing protein n=1 Tax=gut metagenome TaxID=749906 RepID=J9GA89_9ZZZZ
MEKIGVIKNMKTFFTSESVTKGHPDKVCDQISDCDSRRSSRAGSNITLCLRMYRRAGCCTHHGRNYNKCKGRLHCYCS